MAPTAIGCHGWPARCLQFQVYAPTVGTRRRWPGFQYDDSGVGRGYTPTGFFGRTALKWDEKNFPFKLWGTTGRSADGEAPGTSGLLLLVPPGRDASGGRLGGAPDPVTWRAKRGNGIGADPGEAFVRGLRGQLRPIREMLEEMIREMLRETFPETFPETIREFREIREIREFQEFREMEGR